jgi:hypothetical protein
MMPRFGRLDQNQPVVGEIEVTADLKRKLRREDRARAECERRHQENALDEALRDTFPASDPVSIESSLHRAL